MSKGHQQLQQGVWTAALSVSILLAAAGVIVAIGMLYEIVDGLANVRISRNGEEVLQLVEFDPGQYTVVVEGHPIDG
jgi:hypothetical protein